MHRRSPSALSTIALLAALLPLAGLPGAGRAATARGVVFEDVDGDGVRDEGEPGLAEVRVSNGRDVVRTDDEGRYRLAVDDADVVFVTKPAGFAVPVDGRMIPRFYYVHQPEGSPPHLRYPGVAPTGPLPASVDFPLRRVDEPERFEALLFADPQPQTGAEIDYLREEVVSRLVGTSARFGMTMGDILFDDLSLFPRYNSVIASIGIPWYNVPGNHELNFESEDDAGSLETFKRHFGPPYYAFEVGRAVFVVLDNIHYRGGGEADPGDLRGSGGYEARVSEDQLRWLERELALVPEEKLVFLAMHAPLLSAAGEPGNPRTNTVNRGELLELLEGRPNLYAVAGHTHTTEHHYLGPDEGFPGPGTLHHHVLATVSGSWWSGPLDERGIPVTPQRDGTPNGWHVLEVDGTDLRVRYRAAGGGDAPPLRVLLDTAHHQYRPEATRDFRHGELSDGRLSVDQVAATRVLVNLFDGGPRSRVSLRIDDRPPVAMQRVREVDPAVQELFRRHPDAKKPWVEAVPSTHLWAADLPDDLGAGTRTLTVEAVDEFGARHHAHKVIEVEGTSATDREGLRWPATARPAP